jgi:hypothetical protein
MVLGRFCYVETMSTICRVGELDIDLQNQPFMMSLICHLVFASFSTLSTRVGRKGKCPMFSFALFLVALLWYCRGEVCEFGSPHCCWALSCEWRGISIVCWAINHKRGQFQSNNLLDCITNYVLNEVKLQEIFWKNDHVCPTCIFQVPLPQVKVLHTQPLQQLGRNNKSQDV